MDSAQATGATSRVVTSMASVSARILPCQRSLRCPTSGGRLHKIYDTSLRLAWRSPMKIAGIAILTAVPVNCCGTAFAQFRGIEATGPGRIIDIPMPAPTLAPMPPPPTAPLTEQPCRWHYEHETVWDNDSFPPRAGQEKKLVCDP
jgi:hypothetical protein